MVRWPGGRRAGRACTRPGAPRGGRRGAAVGLVRFYLFSRRIGPDLDLISRPILARAARSGARPDGHPMTMNDVPPARPVGVVGRPDRFDRFEVVPRDAVRGATRIDRLWSRLVEYGHHLRAQAPIPDSAIPVQALGRMRFARFISTPPSVGLARHRRAGERGALRAPRARAAAPLVVPAAASPSAGQPRTVRTTISIGASGRKSAMRGSMIRATSCGEAVITGRCPAIATTGVTSKSLTGIQNRSSSPITRTAAATRSSASSSASRPGTDVRRHQGESRHDVDIADRCILHS